jgi:hypothetical protein
MQKPKYMLKAEVIIGNGLEHHRVDATKSDITNDEHVTPRVCLLVTSLSLSLTKLPSCSLQLSITNFVLIVGIIRNCSILLQFLILAIGLSWLTYLTVKNHQMYSFHEDVSEDVSEHIYTYGLCPIRNNVLTNVSFSATIKNIKIYQIKRKNMLVYSNSGNY